jgi:iron complex transport system substrate-binding protein
MLSLFGCANDSGTTKSTTKPPVEPTASATKNASISVTGDTYPLKIKDYLGNETTLETKPQRVAVLSGTPLNIWYDLGGKSICSSDVSDNVRLTEGYESEIKALPQVGQVYAINVESIVSHKPDLIIAQVGTQNVAAATLRNMGFKVILTNIRGFDDVIDSYRAFGKILGTSNLAEQKTEKLKYGKNEIVKKLPDKKTSVAILYVTSKSLAVKLDNSIAGDIAGILKLKNIASNLPPDTIGSETTPLDIEFIVKQNPDYILVTTMISSNEEARKTVENQFASSPAWSSVKAISEGRVIYLPQQYYLYNAGPYYVDAINYLAKSIYPEIYGAVK